MKKSITLTILLISFFFSNKLLAQQKEALVRFANGNLITGNNVQKSIFKKENIQSALFENQYFVVLQFGVLPNKQVKENLIKAGIALDNYMPDNAYLATVSKDFNFETANKYE